MLPHPAVLHTADDGKDSIILGGKQMDFHNVSHPYVLDQAQPPSQQHQEMIREEVQSQSSSIIS